MRYAVLFDRMTELMGEDGMKDWIRMFISTPFYAVSEEAQREAIRNRAVELLKKLTTPNIEKPDCTCDRCG